MLYTYHIDFVNDQDQRNLIKSNCYFDSIETTLIMAKGKCNRVHAEYGAIKIYRKSGSLARVQWFDNVLK